ncbi:MAG TPA: glycosyl hydrolase, partial [bacterium]|nr:glycosyl hydrolase [bacterium]
MMKLPRILIGSAALCLVLNAVADPLETGFLNPPDAAKPQTWWHWMNGNITKVGITADLEAMKQIGLGGATIVNVDCGIPPGPVKFMSPEWREDFKFAVQEADRLGLKLCVENCAGWSSSGGPWNTVTNAMQRLTSSETRAHGPAVFDAVLPQPPVTLGFYRDIAVLAFPAPAVEAGNTSDAATPAAKLEIKSAVYGADGGGSADVKARIVSLIKSGRKSIVADSDELGGDPASGQVKQLRIEFTVDGKPGTATVDEGDTFILPTGAKSIAKTRSFGKTSVDRTFVRPPPAAAGASESIPRDDVLDLTANLGADGRLHWEVPAGNWIILRLGYTPIGVDNHPAPDEGRGLECDKMSKTALDAHWDGFMQKVLDDIGPLAGKALDSSLIDSYEVGNQDWTANFREEFQKRRGYDPLKFLPAFTRHVVDSPAVTERFLWDMRRTVADLFAENYFGHFAELCRQHGLLNAVEPYTGPFESLQSGAPADVVMGEFWTGSQGHPSVKMAASIAHIYGKTIVAAESFTAGPEAGRWQNDPYALKTLGDLMYCQGLNRYVFHRYAMQPWTNRWPGMTMGQWGFHFERTETWWNQGKPWIDYISHCEFLLQQGRAVADAAYFTGESAPVEMRAGNPALPAGYDYDAVNADVLLHGATVQNGRITLASGANYAVLILPPSDSNLTPQFLQRLRELVRDGATVVGPRPQHSPSLAGYPDCDAQVKQLADELWGKCDGKTVLENACGKGRVVWGRSLTDIFAAQHLKPDFEFKGVGKNSRLAYVHRVADGADIYFVSNQRRQFDAAECTFRVSGKVPELWHPDTGVIEPAPVWSAQGGGTQVRLDLEPAGSVFVIFRQAADSADHVVAASGHFKSNPSAMPKLEIQHAVYAATDGAGAMDVTANLAELARDGQFVVVVNNEAMGRDPAVDHAKELRVDYKLGGQPGHATVPENETLALPTTTSFGPAPQWEVESAAKSPTVKVWNSGEVTLRLAGGKVLHAKAAALPAPQEISGGWNLSFPPNWGAPPSVILDKLISWTDHANAGVRYFSGTATYEKEIEISADRLSAGRELWLDLGAVKNFVEVSVNGHDFGVLWKPPFRVNVTSAAKPGVNRLVVKVTNLWPNRLIGDEQLPADCEWHGKELKAWPQWLLDGKPSPTGRLTFTTWHHWTKNSPL